MDKRKCAYPYDRITGCKSSTAIILLPDEIALQSVSGEPVRRYVPILAVFLALGTACAPKPLSPPPIFRFIDRLEERNIAASPLMDTAGGEKEMEGFYPLKSFPLQDKGSGGNPLLLKRKLNMGIETWNILFAPPRSELVYTVDIEKGSLLQFGIAVIRDANLQILAESGTGGEQGVNFRIILESEGRERTLFHKYLPPPEKKTERALSLSHHTIPLTYDLKKARLKLITLGGPQSFSFWINPELYVPEENPRNVILISLDTLRPDHLGCYGYGKDTSPHTDALAGDAVMFLNTFATSPWTLPSHVSLMTALNCINHQVYDSRQKMDPSIPTLADYLHSAGYSSAALTGGGFVSGFYGFDKGFERYAIKGSATDPEAADVLSRAASRWITGHRNRSFFLFLHTYQIHDPYFPPSRYAEEFCPGEGALKKIDMHALGLKNEKRFSPLPEAMRNNIVGLYDAEIRYTDDALIRPLLSQLKELGIYDKTMIVLTSDHGEEFFEHQSWHHTHNLYNETIKVPLLIKFFDSAHKGKRVERFARLTDILPTILDSLGIKGDGGFVDGESLLPLLRPGGEDSEERTFISELGAGVVHNRLPKRVAVNLGPYKLIVNDEFPAASFGYFLHPPPPVGRLEVFDLSSETGETEDLAQSQPARTRELFSHYQARYKKLREGTAEETAIDAKTQEDLKSLGYIK
jgi:arylsulfatase A-like enzyme